MAHTLPGSGLVAWCEHGTPLGHSCQFCQFTVPWRPEPPAAASPPAPPGWTCPSCLHSYAPWVPECHHCPPPPAATPILAAATGNPVAVDLRLPGEWTGPGYQRFVRASGEWREVTPGLQVLLGQPVQPVQPVQGGEEAVLHFRLTPEGAAGDPGT